MKLVRRELSGKLCKDLSKASLIDRVFAMRGINHQDELQVDLKNLHPISMLKDMNKATDLLVDALRNQERILIVGDFDADGATSTTLAVRALRAMGHQQVDYLVPNRFEYGYGLTPEIVVEANKRSPHLIVTVDNGISSIKGVEKAKSLGIKVLITDHHLPAKRMPDADAIVNPNQRGDEFPSKNLAGVGVIFYLMLALKAGLQKHNYFFDNNLIIPNLTELLDLVALGTVADVVTLDQNNRILVEQGLRRMRSGKACEGIQALFRIAKRNISNAVSADLGFACGPRLNAAGRLDDMSLGIECLLTDDPVNAMDYASALDDLNVERRAIEENMKAEAMSILKELDNDQLSGDLPPVLCLYKNTWHQGVIGILAARVRERYNRPTIIFAPADASDVEKADSDIKGSARSIPTIHIRDILDEVASSYPGLLEKFGGHAMAAGLTLEKPRLDEFTQAVCNIVNNYVKEETFLEVCHSDGTLQAQDFDLKCANELRFAAPWGQNFPTPTFDNHFTIVAKRIIKGRHLKLSIRPKGFECTVSAIFFNAELDCWPDEGAEVHLLYKLDVNEFRGDFSLQLMIEKLLA
ncbi:MAG TPA: single-stranded-DNA-specific exonuclease RecJ [Leucothrix sp.]|nr:single-stranded-DNA-specific exonuclease RecJ [Leucothrix sp.]